MFTPIKLNGGIFPTEIVFYSYILSFLVEPMTGGSLLILPILGFLPRTLLLVHSPYHCPFTIMCICCIAELCHTPSSSFLSAAILGIGTAKTRIATCVTHDLHWPPI